MLPALDVVQATRTKSRSTVLFIAGFLSGPLALILLLNAPYESRSSKIVTVNCCMPWVIIGGIVHGFGSGKAPFAWGVVACFVVVLMSHILGMWDYQTDPWGLLIVDVGLGK